MSRHRLTFAWEGTRTDFMDRYATTAWGRPEPSVGPTGVLARRFFVRHPRVCPAQDRPAAHDATRRWISATRSQPIHLSLFWRKDRQDGSGLSDRGCRG